RHVLEPVDRGIFSIHIVADFRLCHGLAHGKGRLRHGIAAQVDDTHTGPYNNQPRDKSPRLVNQEKFSLARRHQPRQDAAPMPTLRPIVQSLTGAESDEVRPLCWSFLYFFCLLCGYYILRPVRDEMAIEGGVQNLPWMMTGTFVTLLLVTPLFGFLSARVPRERLLMTVYAFFGAHLLMFFLFMANHIAPQWTARIFFVWLSVFNLFVVSVFWSFMADLFTPIQSTRLFSVISAGGGNRRRIWAHCGAKRTYCGRSSRFFDGGVCRVSWCLRCLYPSTRPLVKTTTGATAHSNGGAHRRQHVGGAAVGLCFTLSAGHLLLSFFSHHVGHIPLS